LKKGSCEKIEIFPLTLPSPARGEGKHIEIVEKFPPPRRGRARVGVKVQMTQMDKGKNSGR
jgi:hypothetical protein